MGNFKDEVFKGANRKLYCLGEKKKKKILDTSLNTLCKRYVRVIFKNIKFTINLTINHICKIKNKDFYSKNKEKTKRMKNFKIH